MSLDIETRTDIVVAAHVVAEFTDGFDDAPFNERMESDFIDRDELPTLAASVDHLERVLKYARRRMAPRRQSS